jgi:hypothetical protein
MEDVKDNITNPDLLIPNVEAISIDIAGINMLFCAYSPRRNEI